MTVVDLADSCDWPTRRNSVTNARYITECGLCGSTRLDLVLSLGASPPPCVMHPVGERPLVEERYPLELLRCDNCTLVQLSVIVNPDVMFAPDFPYSSGNSKQLHRNFEDLADETAEMIGELGADDLVVDIGANDGTLLAKFDGCRTLGVEPTEQARKIQGDYVEAFFDEQLAHWIVDEYGPAKVVTACNVLAHVEDLGSVMLGIKTLLADDGVLVAENHDLRSVLAGQWDMVYHEHLRFYSPHSFNALLERYGLGCLTWQRTDTHGGSFRMYATRGAGIAIFDDRDDLSQLQTASATRSELRRELAEIGPVIGIGAAARATTIINYCGIDVEDIEYVVEVPGSDKIGHYIPGTGIPVLAEERIFTSDRAGLLLSWHLKDIVVPKLRDRGYTQPIIVPLPELHYA
jgi:hypothetical protein